MSRAIAHVSGGRSWARIIFVAIFRPVRRASSLGAFGPAIASLTREPRAGAALVRHVFTKRENAYPYQLRWARWVLTFRADAK